MNGVKKLILLVSCGLVSACAEVSSVPTPLPDAREKQLDASVATTNFRINRIDVNVPKSLKVSERNSYYPGGDIVWREDPIGNRHEQVKAIFDTAFALGAEQINGSDPVDVSIVVERFHALTERARYTVGGVHAITFLIQLRDPTTGQPLAEPKRVFADLDALGGLSAVRAENQGITQKSRITAHLAEVLRQEMTHAAGYRNEELGIIQVINKL